MKGIFDGAKFGDRFRTRDGRCAVYLGYNGKFYELGLPREKDWEMIPTEADGHNAIAKFETTVDIVGKWEEPIDEEKLADLELEAAEKRRAWATDFYKGLGIPMPSSFSLSDIDEAYMGGYDVGYRKAKEE